MALKKWITVILVLLSMLYIGCVVAEDEMFKNIMGIRIYPQAGEQLINYTEEKVSSRIFGEYWKDTAIESGQPVFQLIVNKDTNANIRGRWYASLEDMEFSFPFDVFAATQEEVTAFLEENYIALSTPLSENEETRLITYDCKAEHFSFYSRITMNFVMEKTKTLTAEELANIERDGVALPNTVVDWDNSHMIETIFYAESYLISREYGIYDLYGESLYTKEDLNTAVSRIAAIKLPERSESLETITFGQFEQDGDLLNGTEPIEWLVLEKNGDSALVVSKKILYKDKIDNVRAWMNDTFDQMALSKKERKAILQTDETGDRFFLLDYDQIVWNLCTDEARTGEETVFAAGGDEACGWWFEVPALPDQVTGNDPAMIAPHAKINHLFTRYENGSSSAVYGIRPACWVNLTVLHEQDEMLADWAIPYTEVGDIVKWGHYEQNNVDIDGKEPIEWVVLESDGKRSLLLSRYILDKMYYVNALYDPDKEDSLWDKSLARKWLNGEFLSIAFNEAEQEALRPRYLNNPAASKELRGDFYDIGCGVTLDRVFLPSEEELVKYLPQKESRITTHTASVEAKQPTQDSSGFTQGEMWWLRTCFTGGVMVSVGIDGILRSTSSDVFSLGVRPMIYLDLESLTQELVEAAQGNVDVNESAMADLQQKQALSATERFMTTGCIVSFGRYEQDGEESNGREPLQWYVLEADESKSLLLSVYGLDAVQYSKDILNTGWARSNVRSWLNNDFLQLAFSEEEAVCIAETTVVTPPYEGQSGGEDSVDKIYLLSADETEVYFTQQDLHVCSATAYAISRGAKERDSCIWWLRSTPRDLYRAVAFDEYGTLGTRSAISDRNVCVRPAMWVRIDLLPGVLSDTGTLGVEPIPTNAVETAKPLDPFDFY